MFLQLDIENAFDKIEWKFLLAIIEKLGFHSTWLNWILSAFHHPPPLSWLMAVPFVASLQIGVWGKVIISPPFCLSLALKFSPYLYLKKKEMVIWDVWRWHDTILLFIIFSFQMTSWFLVELHFLRLSPLNRVWMNIANGRVNILILPSHWSNLVDIQILPPLYPSTISFPSKPTPPNPFMLTFPSSLAILRLEPFKTSSTKFTRKLMDWGPKPSLKLVDWSSLKLLLLLCQFIPWAPFSFLPVSALS